MTIKALSFAIMALGLGLIAPAYVEAFEIEIYKDFDPWFGEKRVEGVLQDDLGLFLGVDYDVHGTIDLQFGIPADAQVVIVPSNSFGLQSSAANVNHPDAQANLTAFVENGGVLIMHMADNLFSDSYNAPGAGEYVVLKSLLVFILYSKTTGGTCKGLPDFEIPSMKSVNVLSLS